MEGKGRRGEGRRGEGRRREGQSEQKTAKEGKGRDNRSTSKRLLRSVGDESWVSKQDRIREISLGSQNRTGSHEGDLMGAGRGRGRVPGSLEELLGVSLEYTFFV